MAVKKKPVDLSNPLTGQAPNSYTQSTNRELPKDKAAQGYVPYKKANPDTSAKASKFVPDVRKTNAEARSLRALHVAATDPGSPDNSVDAPVGYRMPEIPAGTSREDTAHYARLHAWLQGAHHMFPNESADRGEPAINEPHETASGVTAQRRAEDLNSREYAKGKGVLSHFGHGSDPEASLRDTTRRSMNRVMSEHNRAGVNESTSQLFYGGSNNTNIPDADLQRHHESVTQEAPNQVVNRTVEAMYHPKFQETFGHLDTGQQFGHARRMLAQAAADTSPNAKWREGDRWPNLDQASESVDAALSNRPPKFITGRTPNEFRAADRVGGMIDNGHTEAQRYDHQPDPAPKTTAFRGALVDRDNADAFNTQDLHDAGASFPGLPTAKSKVGFAGKGHEKVTVYPDQKTPQGFVPRMKKNEITGESKPERGLSRPEKALAAGGSTVHALRDHAGRSVRADMGLSRSVDHADNTHAAQAAIWGSQQQSRADVQVSHADQYPVIRDWAAEGTPIHAPGELAHSSIGQTLAHPKGLGQQWKKNSNTTHSRNYSREPYDSIPGQ
jgi:hypothetical protein